MCAENLGIVLDDYAVDRAHRLGQFDPYKPRPIIAKFCFFKQKQAILSAGVKLKGTNLFVGEDCPVNIRTARRELLAYVKPKNCRFKLRYDKLYVDNTCFVYDHANQCVTAKDE